MDNGKEHMLDMLMNEVKDCDLCCREGREIRPKKLLKNFIAERPIGPRYGGMPNLWTDWGRRLESKIVFVGQDWGPEIEISRHRKKYEEHVRNCGNPEEIWRQMRTPFDKDRSTPKMVHYLKESARREGLPRLPRNFLDEIFLTNAVLCARQGDANSGPETIDAQRSTRNCRSFLHRQLSIVKPLISVTLGQWPLWSLLESNESLASRINSVHASPCGFLRISHDNVSLAIVPVFHPAARPKDRSLEQQIEDYRYIWRALSNSLNCHGEELINICFPSFK